MTEPVPNFYVPSCAVAVAIIWFGCFVVWFEHSLTSIHLPMMHWASLYQDKADYLIPGSSGLNEQALFNMSNASSDWTGCIVWQFLEHCQTPPCELSDTGTCALQHAHISCVPLCFQSSLMYLTAHRFTQHNWIVKLKAARSSAIFSPLFVRNIPSVAWFGRAFCETVMIIRHLGQDWNGMWDCCCVACWCLASDECL